MLARATLAFMLAGSAAGMFMSIPRYALAHGREHARLPDETAGRSRQAAHPGPRRGRNPAHVSSRRSATTIAQTDPYLCRTPCDADGHAIQNGAHGSFRIVGGPPAQVGLASWYGGKRWNGRPTSEGSRFDENALTAAHATLPLGTMVRVRRMGDDREVVVRITDRPGTRARIIDLSRSAASKLGILDRGIARVSVQAL